MKQYQNRDTKTESILEHPFREGIEIHVFTGQCFLLFLLPPRKRGQVVVGYQLLIDWINQPIRLHKKMTNTYTEQELMDGRNYKQKKFKSTVIK